MGEGEHGHEDETMGHIFLVMLMAIIFLKFLLESYFEKNQPIVGHYTGVIILVGILCSYIIYSSSEEKKLLGELRFKEDAFFNLILPTIVFPSGFNMRRKKFFRNIGPILKFGILGTLICFTFYVCGMYLLSRWGLLTKWDYEEGMYVKLNLDMFQILNACSLLCSSDIIAAISMISYTAQPQLFSIIYGEGVFNDIVSIILFKTVS